MQRLVGILQGVLALGCGGLAVVIAINLGFILGRPDSVSVANVLVAQGLWIIILAAATTVLFRKARRNLSSPR